MNLQFTCYLLLFSLASIFIAHGSRFFQQGARARAFNENLFVFFSHHSPSFESQNLILEYLRLYGGRMAFIFKWWPAVRLFSNIVVLFLISIIWSVVMWFNVKDSILYQRRDNAKITKKILLEFFNMPDGCWLAFLQHTVNMCVVVVVVTNHTSRVYFCEFVALTLNYYYYYHLAKIYYISDGIVYGHDSWININKIYTSLFRENK